VAGLPSFNVACRAQPLDAAHVVPPVRPLALGDIAAGEEITMNYEGFEDDAARGI
jgi:hypothetical protein